MAENITKSCSRVCSQKLEFLRVLIPNPFVKLRIPGKIAKSLPNEPHKRVTLYSPHGKFWHVVIHHEGDDMYLDEGWNEFAKALDLRTGYFVLFQYKVNMVFSVKIFDNTMCLKEYTHNSFKRPIQDLYEDTIQTVGGPSAEDNMYCCLDSSRKRKKIETSHIVERKQGLEKREERINKETLKTSPLSPSFPRFVKIIKSSHSTSNCLVVPKIFCTRHDLVSEREILLVSTTGESWLLQFCPTLCSGELKGFRDFARDNGLRKGDRCTFQLVKKNTFLVHVMASTAEKQQYSPISVQNNVDLIQVPEFERVISRCYLHNLYIPTRVRKAVGLVSDCGLLLLNQEGRSWPVEFFFKSNGEGHLGFGWGKFQRENNLKEGDRCIFKLVEKNVLLVNVVPKESMDALCKEMHTPTQEPNKEIKIMSTKDCFRSVLLEKELSEVIVTNANGTLTSSVVEVPSIEAQKELQNSIIYSNSTGIEKLQSIEALEKAQKNLNSVYVEKALCIEVQKDKVQNNSCSNSTGIEKVQLIKAPEAAQKNMISVCVEKAPCTEAQKEKAWNTTNDSSSTGYEKIPVKEQKKSSSICVEKALSTDATGALSSNLVKEPSIEAQEELQNSISDLSSTGIVKVQSLNPSDEVQKNSSSVYADKTLSTEAHKEKVQNSNCSSSTGIEKVRLIKAPEEQKSLISVCVKKTPRIKAQKEMRRNNTDSSSSAGIENTPIEEQKKSSSVCVKEVPSTDAQKKKVEKIKKVWSLPCVEKRSLIAVQEVQKKMGDCRSTRFPKIEKMVLPHNVRHNYTALSKEFCEMADLHSPCHLILKDSYGKTWQVGYSPNNGIGRLRWKKFLNDKKLKVGDKCIFKLIAHDTLLVNVVRK